MTRLRQASSRPTIRGRRARSAAGALVAASLLGACGGGNRDDEPTGAVDGEQDNNETDETGAGSGAGPVASGEIEIVNDAGEGLTIRVDVTSLSREAAGPRDPGDLARMEVRITNLDDQASWTPGTSLSDGTEPNLSGTLLVDVTDNHYYGPNTDNVGVCVCSDVADVTLAPGDHIDLHASYPAPDAEVTEVDVRLGGLGVMGRVPISSL